MSSIKTNKKRWNKRMYKLIALDMDGTLLREDKTISEKTKEAIKQAKDKGVKVVLASGRPIEGLQKYLKELDLIGDEQYVVSYNGAVVQNTGTKEVINHITLQGSDLKDLYKVSQELNVNIHAFSNKGCITPKMTKYSELEGTMNGIDVHVIDYNEVTADEPIIKMMLVDEPEILEKVIAQLPKALYEKYTIVRSAPFFLEFLNIAVNKGEGVKALAEKLGIKQEEVICIGDAGNDEHMIRYAGLGVAMENGFDELKAIADYITGTNEEDGVAQVIEKFILQA